MGVMCSLTRNTSGNRNKTGAAKEQLNNEPARRQLTAGIRGLNGGSKVVEGGGSERHKQSEGGKKETNAGPSSHPWAF